MPIAMFSGVAGVCLDGTKILPVRRCHLWTEWMDDANQYIGAYSPSSGDETDRYRYGVHA